MATALAIYQPGAWRGRWLKRLLPILNICGRLLPFPLVENPIDEVLRQQLETLFPGHNLEYSLFLGTPSVHQKTVIQIYEGNRILAYAKVADKPAIKQLFNHEQQILQLLHAKGIAHVPTCLYNSAIDADRQLFVMTTEKSTSAKALHQWTPWHDRFIALLQEKTKADVLFEESDYANLLRQLRERIAALPMYKKLLDEIEDVLAHHQGRVMPMAVMHADFTPWNMFLLRDHLFVFDWEYALRTAPCRLDEHHFFVQTAIHEQHLSPKQIVQHYRTQQAISADGEQLKMYLLLQIAIYVCREEDTIMPSTITIYMDILNVLSNGN